MGNNYNGFDSFGGNNSRNQGYPNLDAMYNRTAPREQLQSNKWLVTSLQEALSRPAPLGSRGVYYQQDSDLEYEIVTDFNGRKTYEVYKRTLCSDNNDNTVQRKEFDDLKTKLFELEAVVNGRSSNDTSNGNATL